MPLWSGAKAHGLNWRCNLTLWRIMHRVVHKRYYVIVCTRFLLTQPHLTTSLSGHHLRPKGLSRDNIKNQHKLPESCQWWFGCCRVCLELYNRRDFRFRRSLLQISPTEVLGCVPSSWLRQFPKCHQLLTKALHAVLYRFGDCAHHPARFIIFA